MYYLNEGLKKFLDMTKEDVKTKLPIAESMLIMYVLGIGEVSSVLEDCNVNSKDFHNKIMVMEHDLIEGLKAHDLTPYQEIKIKNCLAHIEHLKTKVSSDNYLDEGIKNFIKKQNYDYLKKLDNNSLVTSEELILGFCVGAIPAVIMGHLVRKRIATDPDAFKAKLAKIKEELDEAKKDKDIEDSESSKTNRMIVKITALNVLITNIVSSIRNRQIKKDKEL